MISHSPYPWSVEVPERPATPAPQRPVAIPHPGSWRYPARRVARSTVALAVIVSAGVHAALLLGIRHGHKAVAAPPTERLIALTVAMPDLKDLEEPEVVPTDEPAQPLDLSMPVPMQADVPQLVRPTDFVQQLNFASMLEQPDFSALKVSVIPENFRSGARLAEKIGKIFDLSELDRTPEPVLQTPPRFPVAMRREGLSGTVMVEFIVDIEGKVLDPFVVDSNHSGFNEAAIVGVSKWKFRAGQRGGRKVNTRMRVPIVFRVEDRID